jgi:hypothetical protein
MTRRTWRSAGDFGLYEDAKVQPYERTAPARPRSDRNRRNRFGTESEFSPRNTTRAIRRDREELLFELPRKEPKWPGNARTALIAASA